MELIMSDPLEKFDMFKFGGLVNQVEHLQNKVDVMEADIKKLVAMAERSKGSLWAIMGFSSFIGGIVTWLSSTFFHK
jgi:hypothetical protein